MIGPRESTWLLASVQCSELGITIIFSWICQGVSGWLQVRWFFMEKEATMETGILVPMLLPASCHPTKTRHLTKRSLLMTINQHRFSRSSWLKALEFVQALVFLAKKCDGYELAWLYGGVAVGTAVAKLKATIARPAPPRCSFCWPSKVVSRYCSIWRHQTCTIGEELLWWLNDS